MGILIDALQESVGTVKHWVRPSAATPLPPNFVILDGSTLVDPDSPFNGMVMRDMRGKFLQGHPTLTNANFAADTTYHFGLGGTIPNGGSATVDLTHDHAAGAHVHAIGSHSHTITGDGLHQHNAPFHNHSIGSDGSHTHSGTTDQYTHSHTNIAGATFNNSFPAGANSSDTHQHNLNIASNGSHSHGGGTGGAGGSTDQNGSHSHGGTTGGASGTTAAGTGNTATSLGIIDKTPPWLGFIAMVKVK